MVELIITERLRIKPITQEARRALSELLLNAEIKKTYMIPDFADRDALIRMTDRFVKLSAAEDHFVRGIYLEGRLIGVVNDVQIQGDCIELGYALHPRAWGNGYATEMLRAVIQALHNEGVSSVKTGAFSENIASIRVMEKCGMRRLAHTETVAYRGENHLCVYYEASKDGKCHDAF